MKRKEKCKIYILHILQFQEQLSSYKYIEQIYWDFHIPIQ